MTLRTRLLAALLALLAAVCVVVGVVSVFALDSFLVDRVDGQLATASARFGDADQRRPPDAPPRSDQRTPPPGLADGTLNAHLSGGTVADGGVISGASFTPLSAAQEQVLEALPVDGRTPATSAATSGTTGCARSRSRTGTSPSPGCRCPGCTRP